MVTALTDGIYWFDLTGVNAYLVADSEELVLVDTGTRFDAGTIESGIAEAGYRLDAIDRILITHYDVDHVGGLGTLPVDAPIHVGSPDDSLLTGSRKPLLSGLKSFTQRVSSPLIPAIDSRRVAVVTDGDRIGNFTATHTPGHTPGHTVYVHEELSAAFLGDAIIERNGSFRPTPWFLSSDVELAHESIRSFAETATFDVAAMGHGTPVTTGGSKRLEALAAEL